MKIGILTLPFNVNYGGILQAYALQTYLKSLGHTVVFINRVHGRPGLLVIFKRFLSLAKCLCRKYLLRDNNVIISNPFGVGYVTKEYNDLDWSKVTKFVQENLVLTHPIDSTRKLKTYIKTTDLDCVLVGSDQVWRDCYVPNIYNYFLDFVPDNLKIKKVSYAASFGVYDVPIPCWKLRKCRRLASRLDAISVREDAAVEYLYRTFGLIPQKIIDPTLLLTTSDYEEFVSEPINNEKRYIAAYILNMTQEKATIIDTIRTYLDMDVQILSTEPDYSKSDYALSLEEWLTAISHSSFVITDSYHGSIFAIQFKKQFVALSNNLRGNERFLSLFESLGLQCRLFASDVQPKLIIDEIEKVSINYIHIEQTISMERLKALEYLSKALK